MIRRLVFTAAAISALAAPLSATAHAEVGVKTPAQASNDYGDWWCISIRPLDTGFCQGDPNLPDVPTPKPSQLLPPLPRI